MINIAEILKDCPKGTMLYSPICGKVILDRIENNTSYSIVIQASDGAFFRLSKYGEFYDNTGEAECLLFPSKDQRDWTKFKVTKERFDPQTFKPFDKVLVRVSTNKWRADFFSYIEGSPKFNCICVDTANFCCIPYNDDTKHLVGTTYDCPDYYKWWKA